MLNPKGKNPMLQDIPATFQEQSNKGGLFTLFLHSPLQGPFSLAYAGQLVPLRSYMK